MLSKLKGEWLESERVNERGLRKWMSAYVLVAFAPAEAKHFGVVTDESDALAGIARAGAEVACFYSGGGK